MKDKIQKIIGKYGVVTEYSTDHESDVYKFDIKLPSIKSFTYNAIIKSSNISRILDRKIREKFINRQCFIFHTDYIHTTVWIEKKISDNRNKKLKKLNEIFNIR